uniref:SWI/SNF complex subunit SWI3B n=1 Tax=Tanacetum cinerariifolium TaxID=118510 RepID=A0A6L2M9T9_TANCI|nr:SWI/SNF complex subunit SWI3B [Tanacetum cinerariifolium]
MATNSGNITKSTTTTLAATPSPTLARARESNALPESDVILVPSYSSWFSWNDIHECEVRNLPEFFDGKSSSKTPKVYKYYRNTMIKMFRDRMKVNPPTKDNPYPKITYTEARKALIGDVGSVRKVFDFLEQWGLINYFGSTVTKGHLKWDDKESKNVSAAATQQNSTDPGANVVGDASVAKTIYCSGCNKLCENACYINIKKDTTFCARCYLGARSTRDFNTSDFKRVEITEKVKIDWTEKQILHLLEAVAHYGDNWKKVSEHVGRSEKECVERFIKLPFGEQYIGPPDSVDPEENFCNDSDQLDNEFPLSKKMRLTPFDDASNPILAQVAFLSTLVGVEVAEKAASAAVKALTEVNNETILSSGGDARDHDSVTINGSSNTNSYEGAYLEAKSQLEKEELELESTISDIAEVQAKDIHDKIVCFEELELLMEREWQQVKQMQHMLFADQLSLLFKKKDGTSRNESMEQKVKAES